MARVSWDQYFMNIAAVVASRSTCPRKYVGAVIVRDRTILSTGYNGSIRGMPHCSDAGHMMENDHCVATIHAEANAIIQAAKNGVMIDGGTVYVTASPCWNCFKQTRERGHPPHRLRRVLPRRAHLRDRCPPGNRAAEFAAGALSHASGRPMRGAPEGRALRLLVALLLATSGVACQSGGASHAGSGGAGPGTGGNAGAAGSHGGGGGGGAAGSGSGGQGNHAGQAGAGGFSGGSGGHAAAGGKGGKGDATAGAGGRAAGAGGLGGSAAAVFARLCGNGIIDQGEDCDDDNMRSGDGCTKICQREAGWTCPQPGEPCDPPRCGDGIRDDNEACDDANTNSGDGCASDCQSIEKGWTCSVPGKHCRSICGDALLEGAEECDDGNTDDGDGCSEGCRVEPAGTCPPGVCGDGVLSCHEACDNGPDNTDGLYGGCTTSCKLGPYCGDANVDSPDEACDSGNRNAGLYMLQPSPSCGWTCQFPAFCGDGHLDSMQGEACDLGADNGQMIQLPDGSRREVCDTRCQFQ